jgi:predicted transcriptional regulator of viral defense system
VYTFVPVSFSNEQLPTTFTYAQARAAGLSKHAFYRLRNEKRIELLSRGIYRRTDREVGDLELLEIAQRAPEATLCLTTALAKHGLSDEIPQVIDVALPRGTRKPTTAAPTAWHYFDRATFELGRSTLRLEGGVTLGIYSPERCIIDAFRTRGRNGHELAYDALKRWLRQRGNSSPATLLKLAASFPGAVTPLRKALEILL